MNPIIETKNVWKVFGMNGVAVEAVRGISLAVQEGEFLAIVGPSGSGKSSLLHLLGVMDRPTRGEVYFQGKDLAKLGDGARADLRARQIGFVFQTFNLLPAMSSFENVEIALRLGGLKKSERQARTQELLQRVGLSERFRHLPRHLSGGERQRVAVARALANGPQLLLADEPTGNLDSKTGTGILELLRSIRDEDHRAVVMVTHDLRAASYADRVIMLRDGEMRGESQLPHGQDNQQALSQLLALGW
jgi:putative ABC transport system ATP-binding protein